MARFSRRLRGASVFGRVRWLRSLYSLHHRLSAFGPPGRRKGRNEIYEETKERELVTVQVSPTLDTTESKEARLAEGPAAPARLRLFVSYQRGHAPAEGAFATPHDPRPARLHSSLGRQATGAGRTLGRPDHAELEAADIVLLIYSTGTRASTYVQEKEIPLALKREGEGKCTLLVVPLDRDDWDPAVEVDRRLGELMTATWKAKPVLSYKPPAKGWLEVEHSIRKAVEVRRGRRGE